MYTLWCRTAKFDMVTHVWTELVLRGQPRLPFQGGAPAHPNFWVLCIYVPIDGVSVYGLVYDRLGSSGMRWSRISCRCVAVKSERVSFAQKISTKLQVQLQICRTTTFGVVTHMGRGRVLGVGHAIAYCTNASRGLSANSRVSCHCQMVVSHLPVILYPMLAGSA